MWELLLVIYDAHPRDLKVNLENAKFPLIFIIVYFILLQSWSSTLEGQPAKFHDLPNI